MRDIRGGGAGQSCYQILPSQSPALPYWRGRAWYRAKRGGRGIKTFQNTIKDIRARPGCARLIGFIRGMIGPEQLVGFR